MAPLSRSELAERIAIDRADYERQYADREAGWQPMVPFVKDAAFRIAKRETKVQGITVNRGTYGVSFYARVDWRKLAERVERQVPRWKETMERMEREGATV